MSIGDRRAAQAALEQHQRCLISTHVSPEGDALGSALALAHALRGMGKEALVINRDPVPRLLDFLPAEGLYRRVDRPDEGYDLLVVVDCGDLERTALFRDWRPPLVVNIDHHITNKQFGQVNWVDPGAAATAVMIADLLGALRVDISKEIALCLYTALMTETGSFKYSNTTPAVFRLAAELAERGVQPAWVSQKIFERNTVNRLKLLGALLERMELSPDRTVAWVTIPAELFARTGTTAEDAEDFVNYPRSLTETEVAILLRDAEPGRVKVSFRTSGEVDVAAIASQFGGGGHRKAAGCTVAGTLDTVRPKVIEAAERAVRQTLAAPR
ncbi:MAG TPA: bifunctional oligoribonuclease/PAP phosphatase NrnA [Nitrospiria bacterium]|nr:bifunctional oligoribonuclease/PAP phosphatase NrnA [Nitrospiria bacterium]